MARAHKAKRRRLPGAAPLFAALGDDKRLALVAQLCAGGPMSITSLASGASVSRQAITKHLRMMERAGIVRSARQGRECLWRVDPESIDSARRYLKQISVQWDDALARLKALVE